jgi:hypothetical protein
VRRKTLICVENIFVIGLLLCVFLGVGNTEQRMIEMEGVGMPASEDAPLEIKKQEAFIAAVLTGIRNVAEYTGPSTVKTILKYKDENKKEISSDKIFLSFHGKIENIEVDSQSIVENWETKDDLININYNGQSFIIKMSKLLSPPIEFVEFPKWDNPPKTISGIDIKDIKWDAKEEVTVKLSYLYDSTKVKNEPKDVKILNYEFEKDKSGSFIYQTISIDGIAHGGGTDTPDAMMKKALDQALRNAVEKSNGVFIQSLTQVENSMLKKDEIIVQTMGIANVVDKKFNSRFNSEGTFEIVCSVIAKVPILRIVAK